MKLFDTIPIDINSLEYQRLNNEFIEKRNAESEKRYGEDYDVNDKLLRMYLYQDLRPETERAVSERLPEAAPIVKDIEGAGRAMRAQTDILREAAFAEAVGRHGTITALVAGTAPYNMDVGAVSQMARHGGAVGDRALLIGISRENATTEMIEAVKGKLAALGRNDALVIPEYILSGDVHKRSQQQNYLPAQKKTQNRAGAIEEYNLVNEKVCGGACGNSHIERTLSLPKRRVLQQYIQLLSQLAYKILLNYFSIKNTPTTHSPDKAIPMINMPMLSGFVVTKLPGTSVASKIFAVLNVFGDVSQSTTSQFAQKCFLIIFLSCRIKDDLKNTKVSNS